MRLSAYSTLQALAQEITDHKPELDTTVHSGKVAEYAGPAEEADSQPSRPQSGYSIAVKRYEDAVVACQDRIHQLEETLNKISEVKNDIEQLIESLNQCQSKISNTGRFRVKPDDAKAQLTSAKVSPTPTMHAAYPHAYSPTPMRTVPPHTCNHTPMHTAPPLYMQHNMSHW